IPFRVADPQPPALVAMALTVASRILRLLQTLQLLQLHILQILAFCGIKGHTIEVCRKRLSRERNASHANTSAPANNSVSLLSSSESALNVFHLDPAMVSSTPNSAVSTTTAPEIKHNAHVFALSDSAPNLSKWVLDSGATCCATYAEADCVDVRECQAHVTAAGSTFSVNKMGTAVIETQDEKGRPVQLRMTDTLISAKFPY